MKERLDLREIINSYFVKKEIKDFSDLANSLIQQGDFDNKLGLDTSSEVSYLMSSIAWNISRKKETRMFADKSTSADFLRMIRKKYLKKVQK